MSFAGTENDSALQQRIADKQASRGRRQCRAATDKAVVRDKAGDRWSVRYTTVVHRTATTTVRGKHGPHQMCDSCAVIEDGVKQVSRVVTLMIELIRVNSVW